MNQATAKLYSDSGRRHAAAWGAVLAYASAILTIARNIILVPVYLHFIPIAIYGAWLATGATLVQIVVTDYGLAGILMQRASALHGAGKVAELGPLVSAGTVVAAALALVLSLLSIALLPLLPEVKGFSHTESAQLAHCFLLAVLANAIGIVAATAMGFVRSLQQSILAGCAGLIADLANIAITLLLLFSGAGITAIADGLVTRSLVLAAILIVYLLIVCRRHMVTSLAFGFREARSLFVDSWHSFVLSLAMKVQTQGNTFFVGTLLGPESAAIYGLTVRAHDTVLMALSLMNNAFAPSMAHLVGSGNIERFKDLLMRLAPTLALFAALGMVAAVIGNQQFVSLWVGAKVYGGSAVSILVALAVCTSTVGYVAYDALYALGQFRYVARTYVITALVHVLVLTTLLRYGLWTVGLASVVSSLLWGTLFWRRTIEETKLSPAKTRSATSDLLLIGLCAVMTVIAFQAVPKYDSWLNLILRAAAGAMVFGATTLFLSTRLRAVIQEEISATMRALFKRS